MKSRLKILILVFVLVVGGMFPSIPTVAAVDDATKQQEGCPEGTYPDADVSLTGVFMGLSGGVIGSAIFGNNSVKQICRPLLPAGARCYGDDYKCKSGKCLELPGYDVCTPEGVDAKCSPNSVLSGCTPGQICNNWQCVDKDSLGVCTSSQECKETEFCDIKEGICVPKKGDREPCPTGQQECKTGFVCYSTDGEKKCVTEDEFYNQDPNGTPETQEVANCGHSLCNLYNHYCKNNKCLEKKVTGLDCDNNDECWSNLCWQGQCMSPDDARKYDPSLYGARTLPGEIDFGFVKLKPENWVDFLYHLLLSFGGFISLVMIIVNSIKLMTSGHNPEEVQNAIKGIQQALLGLALVLIGAAIVTFVNNLAIGGLG